MIWFQPIECDKTVKRPLVCNHDNFDEYGFSEDDFKIGKNIENWNNDIFMKANEKRYDGNPDDALQNYMMIPIYSERLVMKLKEANVTGIQYLPIKVLRPNNDLIGVFYIANFLNHVEAFDYEKSLYNRFGSDFPNLNVRGQIAGVRKFVLKKERCQDSDIIRLKDYNLRFFVSEKIKTIFEENKFTGYSFREVELS